MSFVSLGNFWRPSPTNLSIKDSAAGVRPLLECPYGIFKKDEAGHLRWCGAAQDVPCTKAQIGALAADSQVESLLSLITEFEK